MNQQDTLLDVVDRLTIEHPYAALIEGKKRWVRRDPLIKTLRESIASSIVGGSASGGDKARIPFDADAMAQHDLLEQVILGALASATDAVPHVLPEANLRAWYAAAHETLTDADYTLWLLSPGFNGGS